MELLSPWMIVAIVVIFVLNLLVRKGGGGRKRRHSPKAQVDKQVDEYVAPAEKNIRYRYVKKSALFTNAEKTFYEVLREAVRGKAIVFGKVRIADVLYVPSMRDYSIRTFLFNKISAKHFDYVLCDPNDLSIISVIELDDSSHNTNSRRSSDEIKDKACNAANLKLHRFRTSSNYEESKIRETIFSVDG